MRSRKIRTMADFAASVGLSRPTISKYFQDPLSVRAVTRTKIDAAVKTTGFRPNLFAINLNRRRSNIIGIIIPDPLDPFYMALARRVEILATEAGYLSFLTSSEGQAELEEKAVETLMSLNVAGAIVAPLGERSHKAKLRKLGEQIPLVYVDQPLDGNETFVGTNNQQSIALITNYMSRLGDPPAFFDMPLVNRNTTGRRRAYEETMTRLGLEPVRLTRNRSVTWEFEKFAFDEMIQVIKKGRLPSRNIICANDRIAFGVLAALHDTGVKVGITPDCEVRVAGHDNNPFSQFTCPALTTVSQNYGEIGNVAFNMLQSKIKSHDAGSVGVGEARRTFINAELVLRKSA